MKINLKSMIFGGIIGAVIMGAIPAAGYDGVRTIQAVYKNIRICVDGVEMTPRDSAGQVVEPFIYNGTTYLPVRAVGEAVGKEVTYDGSTSTVYLGKSGQVDYLGQQVKAYQTKNAKESSIITMGGNDYHNGLLLEGSAYYNLNSKYNTVSGVYGMQKYTGPGSGFSGKIVFYGDSKLIASYDVSTDDLPKDFNLNVTGVNQLKIEFTYPTNYIAGTASLGNVEFR